MSTHGEAPGPGYALVVNQAGFDLVEPPDHEHEGHGPNNMLDCRLCEMVPAPSRPALSGEGMLACFWLSVNPLWEPETWPEPGTFIKLPISNGFMEMAQAEVNGWKETSPPPPTVNDSLRAQLVKARETFTGPVTSERVLRLAVSNEEETS